MPANEKRIRLLGIDYGDPHDIATFSGSSYHIWTTMKNKVNLIDAFTPYPSQPVTIFYKLLAFRPSAQKWRASWRRSIRFKRFISKRAAQIVKNKYSDTIDATLQIGAYYNIEHSFDGVRTLLADNNCAITQKTNINFQSSDRIFQRQFAFEKEIYNSMDRVFCFSNFLADSMVKDFGVPRERVKVVYAGINTEESLLDFPNKDYSKKTVLFSGFDFANKGGHVLLDAFARVRLAIPDARLILLGPSLASVPKGVTNHGPLSKNIPDQLDKIIASYRDASIFVLPTFADAFPNVVREAMAARLPTIASQIGSIPEMLTDGETGYLIPARQAAPLANRIIELLNNPELCRRMGNRAYSEYKARFRWESVCDKIVNEISSLLSERGGRK